MLLTLFFFEPSQLLALFLSQVKMRVFNYDIRVIKCSLITLEIRSLITLITHSLNKVSKKSASSIITVNYCFRCLYDFLWLQNLKTKMHVKKHILRYIC